MVEVFSSLLEEFFSFMEVVKVNIRLCSSDIQSFKYRAEVIRHNKKFYYRAIGALIKITPYEAKMIIRNPKLYYFSTALKLHCLIENKFKRDK